MKKIAIILISLITLSGCYDAPDKVKPLAFVFEGMPKDAPNNYKRGWKDGCETGLSVMTNAMYKTFWTFKQDKKLRADSTYYTAWKAAYNYCRSYAYGTIRQANVRTSLPNAQNEVHDSFLGADGGIFSGTGLLQLWGPGDWLLPFQKIGPIGGDPYLAAVGGGAAWSEYVMGQSNTLNFSDGYMPLGFENGMNMDYQSGVPFFDATGPTQ